MKIDFTGRGVEINDRIRAFTASKMDRLKRQLDDIRDVVVVLAVEKYRQRAEIRFQASTRVFHGADETNDMFQSIDRVMDKLEAQVRKFKEKINAKKRNTTETIRAAEEPAPASAPVASGEIQVIRNNNAVKPMNVEEAVEELLKLEHEFILFRNADTNALNVVYRRKDGNVGLVDPGN